MGAVKRVEVKRYEVGQQLRQLSIQPLGCHISMHNDHLMSSFSTPHSFNTSISARSRINTDPQQAQLNFNRRMFDLQMLEVVFLTIASLFDLGELLHLRLRDLDVSGGQGVDLLVVERHALVKIHLRSYVSKFKFVFSW